MNIMAANKQIPNPPVLPLPRFRRDVLEGTLEEMLEEVEEEEEESHKEEGNSTMSRQRRQAEFPGAPEQDNTK